MSRLLRFALPPLILVLASCIDGDEEIWLEPDGSGRLEATYKMPPQIMQSFGSAPVLQKKLEDAIAKEPGITINHMDHHMENGRVVFELDAAFDDVRTLAAFPKKHLRNPDTPDQPASEEALFGTMNLELNGLTMAFDRSIDLGPVLPDNVRQNPGFLGESAFRYVVHLPSAADTHNATGTADNGRTLKWKFLLREHASRPMVLTMKAPLPLPWWIWLVGGLLITLVVFLLVLTTRRVLSSRRLPTDGLDLNG
jgi:hypothetical protein